MAKIDNDKMWESLYRYGHKYEHFEDAIQDALKDQGLKYNEDTKKIESIAPKPEYYKTRKEMTKESSDGELSELEKAVLDIIPDHNTHTDSVEEFARRNAKSILSVARKQLQPEIDAEIEKAYKNQDEVQYRNGYNKCVEDARNAFCKTCKIGKCNSSECVYLNDFKKALIGE